MLNRTACLPSAVTRVYSGLGFLSDRGNVIQSHHAIGTGPDDALLNLMDVAELGVGQDQIELVILFEPGQP